MSDLKGQPAEVRFTITIKRAATGKVETHEMVGHSDPEKLAEILAREQTAISAVKPNEES